MNFVLTVRIADNEIAIIPGDTPTAVLEYVEFLIKDVYGTSGHPTFSDYLRNTDADIVKLSHLIDQAMMLADNAFANDMATGFEAYLADRVKNPSAEDVRSYAATTVGPARWQS